jgi:hypothetical protein
MAVSEVRSARRIAASAVAVLALTVAGCSSSSKTTSATGSSSTTASSPSTYPAGKEQLCAARDQLRSSITAVARPSLLIGGKDAITTAVDKVQSDLDALKVAAKQTYRPQVDAVEAALGDLKTAVGTLGNGNTSQNLQTVGTDIANVGSTSEDLLTTLKTSCGS